MAIPTKIISCPHCEGTGKELNYFDPPVAEYRKLMTISDLKRSPSGREILDDYCPACNGTIRIMVPT
ncbi:hypothetical protein A9485_08620 [Bacillus cereus]|uniref:hypothetical protein n=1 Tax=Bacillus cereus TaxID=1396 RepID=UPI0008FDBB79|nr:hypothetical protein [Bacillus cereus]OJD90287.1 hypothetical protein A9485_08620 [Bacillus cereus]